MQRCVQAAALADSNITADNVKLQNFMDSFAGVFLASHLPGADNDMHEHFARACSDLPNKFAPDMCQMVQARCHRAGCKAPFDRLRVQPMPDHVLASKREGFELPAISPPPPSIPTASAASAPDASAGSTASVPEHGSQLAGSQDAQASSAPGAGAQQRAQRADKGKRNGGKRCKRRFGQPVDTNIVD